jgi:peptide/nickel transport system ATP-binding protein
MTPSLVDLPEGCAFRTRCAHADAACLKDPPPVFSGMRVYRCVHPVAEVA